MFKGIKLKNNAPGTAILCMPFGRSSGYFLMFKFNIGSNLGKCSNEKATFFF